MLFAVLPFPRTPGLQPELRYHLPSFPNARTLLQTAWSLVPETPLLDFAFDQALNLHSPSHLPVPALCSHMCLRTHLPAGGHVTSSAPCQQLGLTSTPAQGPAGQPSPSTSVWNRHVPRSFLLRGEVKLGGNVQPRNPKLMRKVGAGKR